MNLMPKLMQCVRWVPCAALALAGLAAHAHKASDSYVQVDATEQGLAVRWDIALRDLDAELDLDTNEDGKLTWAEVKAAQPRVQAYAMARLQIEGCALRPTRQALERRNDGAYAVLFLVSDCLLTQPPVIAYTLLREVDPTHRGIAKVQLAGQPLALSLLDPTHPAAIAEPVSADLAARGPAAIESTPEPPSPAASAVATKPASSGPVGLGFLREGIRHIVSGYDHVLFLLCLLLPAAMRRKPQGWQPVDRLGQATLPVVGIVTAFTLAHSITLTLAALKLVSLPSSFIEPAIAVTIVLTALDNLWPIFHLPRAAVAFFFGLIHGFGFASVLAELDLPVSQFAWALLQFNLGIEAGQLCIVLGATAALYALRHRSGYPRWVIQGGSLAAMAIGTLWFIERAADVSLLPL
ncbi:MAG TPA: HupE/UreJ family protein [Lysobacter sp.]|nr:HupE/UreJ family protein [Lysobacter sp.]